MKKPSSPHAGVPARDDRGFTLVELIVAIVILAIIVIPLLNTFVVGAKTAAKATAYGNATDAAQNLAETVQAADAAVLLSDPTKVIPGATLSGSQITLSNYSYGGQNFDAVISMAGTAAEVPVSSALDWSPDMTSADTTALTYIKNANYPNGGAVSSNLQLSDITNLTRKIKINIEKTNNAYTAEVVFTYTGSVSYTYTIPAVTDAVGNVTTAASTGSGTANFSYDVTSGVYTLRASEATAAPYYSICLYYKGFYANGPVGAKDEINIVTPEADTARVFLVDTAVPTRTATTHIPSNYSATVDYKWQNFQTVKNDVVNRLVFSNMTGGKMGYYALRTKNSVVSHKQTLTEYLTNVQDSTRKWSVDISIYPAGAEKTDANRIAQLQTTKLA